MRFIVKPRPEGRRGYDVVDTETTMVAALISHEYANQVATAMNRNSNDPEYHTLFAGRP